MIVAVRGFVSEISEYTPKGSEKVVTQAHIATGEHMIRMEIPDDVSFEVMDQVLLVGRLRVWNREVYITGGSIRLATADDISFFSKGGRIAQEKEAAAIAPHVVKSGGSALPKGEA